MAGDWHVGANEDREILSNWIETLCAELDLPRPPQALVILQKTLHAIRDFLPVDRAVLFSDSLPFIIRCVYFAGWKPGAQNRAARGKRQILDQIGQSLGAAPSIPPEEALIAVLALLRRKLPEARPDIAEVLSFRDLLRVGGKP